MQVEREVVILAAVGREEQHQHVLVPVHALLHAAQRGLLLEEPSGFLAVGEWYQDFDQVSDEEVVAMLREAGR